MIDKHVFVLLLAILLSSCGGKSEASVARNGDAAPKRSLDLARPGEVKFAPDSPGLRQLKIESVTEEQVPVNTVAAPGKIEVNPNRVSHVVLPVAGRIVGVLVGLGDAVAQGAPVLKIESSDADAAVGAYAQSLGAVSQAKAALLKANADLDRARDLYQHQAIANKEVLNDESVAAQARAALEQAEAAEGQARGRLDLLGLKPGQFGQQLTVKAPVSGKILEVNVVPGEYRNDLSASLMTIADLSTVWASSDVPETDIRFIRTGEPLTVELSAYPGESFRGRVTRIADIVDPQTRTIKVRAELSNPGGRLRPEMFGEVHHVGGTSLMPVIPATAVVRNEGNTFVYREISPGVFQPSPVTLGEKLGDRVAVRSGVSAGDRVVTEGVLLLRTS